MIEYFILIVMYDRKKDIFDSVKMKNMPLHTFPVVLFDGNVLLIGGEFSNAALNSCVMFNPRTFTFNYNVTPMNKCRKYHVGLLLPSGNVFVSGGKNKDHDTCKSCELYIANENRWVEVSNMTHPRCFHGMVLINFNTVMVVGGYDDLFKPIKNCEFYNIQKNEWRDAPSLPEALAKCGVVAISS